MKKLITALFALLTAFALQTAALADIAQPRPSNLVSDSGGKWVVAVVVAVVIVAAVIIVGAIRYRKNNK